MESVRRFLTVSESRGQPAYRTRTSIISWSLHSFFQVGQVMGETTSQRGIFHMYVSRPRAGEGRAPLVKWCQCPAHWAREIGSSTRKIHEAHLRFNKAEGSSMSSCPSPSIHCLNQRSNWWGLMGDCSLLHMYIWYIQVKSFVESGIDSSFNGWKGLKGRMS